MAWPQTPDPLARMKVLLDSSTPIVAIETVGETRAVRLVRAACAALNLAAFEWTIASGLVRCGSEVGKSIGVGYPPSLPQRDRTPLCYLTNFHRENP